MFQRLMLISTVVMTIACCAMAALLWRAVVENSSIVRAQLYATRQLVEKTQSTMQKQATQDRETFMAALEQNRKFQADTASRLEQFAERTVGPSDWNLVELKLVEGTKQGPPAKGISVVMLLKDLGREFRLAERPMRWGLFGSRECDTACMN